MPRTVSQAYPELLHYTSISGLLGIIDSQSLWATHFAFLNDSTEIAYFFDIRLAKVLEAGIRDASAADPRLQVPLPFANTSGNSESAVLSFATYLAQLIRKVTIPFNQPYLACFSGPTNVSARRDGLLSQWRGYGKDGGYALVFDTNRLELLLKKENESYWYQHGQFADVHYHQGDDSVADAEPDISESEEALQRAIARYMKNPVPAELESMLGPITNLSCRYKHWGFHEEREVRIIAVPPSEDLLREGRNQGESRPVRQPKIFVRSGNPVPYLDLLAREPRDEKKLSLPITQIIIGPHPQSLLRKQAIETLLRSKGIVADVVTSQIPYVGA